MSSIVLTADTLLGTPTIGSVEFDGKAFYNTAQGTQRGVIPGAQFFRLNADYVGTASTSAQGIYGSSLGVTLSSSTVYAFEMVVVFSKTATATAHSLSLSFAGAATINNILYGGVYNALSGVFTSGSGSGPLTFFSNTAAATSMGNASATANFNWPMQLRGTVSINGGGPFIPQYTTSVSVGPYSTLAGSYFRIYPIGASGANISVGAWA